MRRRGRTKHGVCGTCGHGEEWVDASGVCQYGADRAFGACGCVKLPAASSLVARIDAAIEELKAIRAELSSRKPEPKKQALKEQKGNGVVTHTSPFPSKPSSSQDKEYPLGLSRIERSIVTALSQSKGGLSQRALGIWSGYSSTSGNFNQAIADLRAASIIVGTSANLTMTKEGRAMFPHVPALPSGRELRAYWVGKRSKLEGEILETLSGLDGCSSENVGEALGKSHTSGNFNQALANLRALGLISGKSSALFIAPELRE